MQLSVIGLNHHTASLEVREQAALGPVGIQEALGRLRPVTQEAVLLSTCNRTELYLATQDSMDAVVCFRAAFPDPALNNGDRLFTFEGEGAVRHLFRVACGVDSMVFGEAEIMGQVRRALELARDSGTVGPLTSRLFETALAVGKRVRHETGIGKFPASVSSAAVALAQQVLGRDLSDRTVLVIGAGEVGQAVARALIERGAGKLMVANHRAEGAFNLANRYSGVAVSWPIPTSTLALADIIISSTSAPEPVLWAGDIREAMALRNGSPLHLIDLAVPRDIDPKVARLRDVRLHNVDDIKDVVSSSIARRRRTQPPAEEIIAEETARFGRWRRERAAVPTIRELRTQTESIRSAEMRWALGKLSGLSERERDVVDMMTSRLVNKLLHAPTTRLRRAAATGDGAQYRRVAGDLFGLSEARASTKEEQPETE
jgi:glutamyl-tRNA reductase